MVLKIIDLCQTPEELRAGLGMLRDLIKDNWAASEEMERFRKLLYDHTDDRRLRVAIRYPSTQDASTG